MHLLLSIEFNNRSSYGTSNGKSKALILEHSFTGQSSLAKKYAALERNKKTISPLLSEHIGKECSIFFVPHLI